MFTRRLPPWALRGAAAVLVALIGVETTAQTIHGPCTHLPGTSTYASTSVMEFDTRCR